MYMRVRLGSFYKFANDIHRHYGCIGRSEQAEDGGDVRQARRPLDGNFDADTGQGLGGRARLRGLHTDRGETDML
jgi:hypothetical protein